MATINLYTTPKGYFPFCSRDNTLPPEKVLTTQIKPSRYFGDNIADSFYNETLKLGETFSIRIPTPILRWHPAKKGTTSRFHDCLSKIFPELENINDKALDKLIKDIRDREK
jgi:hypothetical protein